MNKKSFLLLIKSSPHQTCNMQEAVDMALAISACDQAVSLLFIHDGVFQLKKYQQPDAIGSKNYADIFKALELYEIKAIYIHQASLNERKLMTEDLLIQANPITNDGINRLISQHDITLSF